MCQRANISWENASEKCLELLQQGELLLETKLFRYIKNGNLFFPCKLDGNNKYVVTTILLYNSMVECRFQNIIDLYD